jgi:anti-sigma regulatory factor (Ser/Thr protein kinase)
MTMDTALWARMPAPNPTVGPDAVWQGEPATAAELTHLRRQLRADLRGGRLPAGDDEGERLLLAFEELTSNGLRHGGPPVRVAVTAADGRWLLEVSDTATDRPPVPPADRDAAHGGLGLNMVARLSGAHGWAVDGDRKTVWASIARCMPGPRLRQRPLEATDRARGLAAEQVGLPT